VRKFQVANLGSNDQKNIGEDICTADSGHLLAWKASVMPPKKGKKKQVEDDWENELGEDLAAPAAQAPVEAPVDDDDLGGGLMGQLGKGKKGKKNKKKQQDDDWEAELGEDLTAAPAPEAEEEPAPATKPQKTSTPQPAQESNDEEDEVPAEFKVKTKAEKEREKKEREKAKKKAQAERKKAAANDTKQETAQDAPTTSKPAGSEAAKGKKPNAKVLALQKALEARKKEEERIAAEYAAEQARVDAENAAIEEEERKKEEAQQRKKEKERAKIAEQKASGTFMTKKQKEAAAIAERRRQEMLDAGMVVEGLQGNTAAKKRPIYDSKRKKKGPVVEATKQLEQLSVKEEPLKKATETPVAAKQEEAKEEEDDGALDSWEAALDSDDEVKESWEAESEPESKPAASAKGVKADESAEEESDDSDSEEDSDSGSDSGSDSSEQMTAAQQAAAKRRADATEAKEKRIAEAKAARSKDDLRSPICCIMGHVDTGKTSLLDRIRQTNVQGGEAGGITQQIGATYFPMENVIKKCAVLESAKDFEYKLPGLLVIDTPGHESFSNLRSRGSSLCNIAILVIDIMHGLEPQTLESIKLLKDKKTPFIVALNKIDRLYAWQPKQDNGFRESLALQKKGVKNEFDDRLQKTKLALAEQGLNSELYYENKNPGRVVSLVPTSAFTGEGVPDLLQLLVSLTQSRMTDKLMYVSELECTVLEVKVIEGLGTTIDVVVVNGVLREGDRIVVSGLNGPIVTTIRAILTPQPLKELRIKGTYVHHKEVKAALGVKIAANDLEKAIAGSRMLRVELGDDEEELKEEVMEDLQDLLESIDRSGVGVYVQASTLGALEALLEFLKTSKIPVSGINIGPVYKRDVMRAATMLEKAKEYAVMLCFDVEIDKDAQMMADQLGVTVFSADIIYHLFDSFTAHRTKALEQKRQEGAASAVFPCVLKTIAVFNKKDPIVLGIDVVEGALRPGTPICAVRATPSGEREIIDIGKVMSMEKEHKAVDIARKGPSGTAIAVKLEMAGQPLFGRHVEQSDLLYSHISRKSIDILKGEAFRDGVSREEWALIVKLKKTFGI
jgi:translation initiation factor 5B